MAWGAVSSALGGSVAICASGRYLAGMRRIWSGPVGAAVLLVAVSAAAVAAQSGHAKKHDAASTAAGSAGRTLGTFEGWTAYVSQDPGGKVCYLAGAPQKSASAGVTRKPPPMAMVTHRPAEKIANVVSFVEGYPLKEGSEVALDVGTAKFELFTKEDSAWARTSELDKTIVTTLAKGGQAVVKGTPQKGSPTTDTYSLAGFDKALAAIDKACGIKRDEKPAAKTAAPAHHKTKSAGN